MSSAGDSPESTAFRARTVLAWQRTGVSVLGGSLVLLRLSGSRGGLLTVPLIVAGGLLGLFCTLESRRRSRKGSEGMGDARVALLMSLAVTLLLVAELVTMLSGT
jgi:uncharacterized membrane protein YidH (DUF202 family)